jgi:tripartite-type tricarboxylate transporter receptor subunit TctC
MKRPVLLIAAVLFSGTCIAQAYPSRAVKVVVPWPPGQATDIAARVVAMKLQEALGQPFVIDNRAGAGGSIGSDVVAKSANDGYTLLASSSGPISIMPSLQKTPYDSQKDFAPVSLIALAPFALVTNPSFPARDAKEFVALARANPDKYAFASSGTGATAHLIVELFNSMAQIKARHVPYKGSAPALTDVMNGQVDYTIETVASVVNHVKSGRLKAYGVSFERGAAAMPDVPPLAKAADVPGFDIGAWIGYSAPAGTPKEVLERLSGEIRKAMQAPDLKERYLALGLEPAAMAPDEMVAFLRREHERYGGVIRNANIKIEN